MSLLVSPQEWQKRAQDMRKLASKEGDQETKQMLEELAAAYEKLAKRAAERISN